ncbi:MAG: GNAT family N-acetyltransferase [Sedimenticola sp.]
MTAINSVEEIATSKREVKSAISKGQSITIRLARDKHDIKRMIDLGSMAHEESQFSNLSYAPEKLMRFCLKAISEDGRKRTCLMMAENGTKLVGVIVASVNEHYFSYELGASALLFYVHPEHRGGMAAIKLLHGFRRWANNRKAKRININVTTGINMARTDKLLRRLGFQFTGGNYVLCEQT